MFRENLLFSCPLTDFVSQTNTVIIIDSAQPHQRFVVDLEPELPLKPFLLENHVISKLFEKWVGRKEAAHCPGFRVYLPRRGSCSKSLHQSQNHRVTFSDHASQRADRHANCTHAQPITYAQIFPESAYSERNHAQVFRTTRPLDSVLGKQGHQEEQKSRIVVGSERSVHEKPRLLVFNDLQKLGIEIVRSGRTASN